MLHQLYRCLPLSLLEQYRPGHKRVFQKLAQFHQATVIGIQSRITVHSLLSTPPVRVRKQRPRASPQYIAAGPTGTTPLKQTGLPALYTSSIMLSLCSLQSSTLLHNRCRLKLLFCFIVPAIPKAHLFIYFPSSLTL